MVQAVAVFGAGVSGIAVASLAKKEGYKIDLFDEREKGCRSDFDESQLDLYTHFIFSPGFSQSHPWRKWTEGRSNVYGELGFSAQRWRGKLIGVTGTNGKTSLTRFLKLCLSKRNPYVHAVGNIGIPLSELVASDHNREDAIAICEISSFQAELLNGLVLDALLWTNFSEDHLDRHGDIGTYFKAKFGLRSTLNEEGHFFVGAQNLLYKERDFWTEQRAIIVSHDSSLPSGLSEASVFSSYPQRWNFHLAHAFLKCYGVDESDIVSAANEFFLDAHRLHVIYEHAGLRIWDDSKSTNLNSVLGALEHLEEAVIWIGGGASKKESIARYAKGISHHKNVEQVVLYGEVGRALEEECLNYSMNVLYKKDLGEAIRCALKFAESYKRVELLFSPGFASFDQFSSYQERGKYFTDYVFSLLKQNPSL